MVNKIISVIDYSKMDELSYNLHNQSFRKVIFFGNYFKNLSSTTQHHKNIQNFKKILEIKENFGDRVILLCGSHDLLFIKYKNEFINLFETDYKHEINALLQPLFELENLCLCHYDDVSQTLFSYAGISKSWYINLFAEKKRSNEELAKLVNLIFIKFPFGYSIYDQYSYSEIGYDGECFIHPFSNLSHPVTINQVVARKTDLLKNVEITLVNQ